MYIYSEIKGGLALKCSYCLEKGKYCPVVSVHGFIYFTWNKNMFRHKPTPCCYTAAVQLIYSDNGGFLLLAVTMQELQLQ